MIAFGLSIPLFFVTTGAWILWILSPILGGQLQRQRWQLRRQRRRRVKDDPPPHG